MIISLSTALLLLLMACVGAVIGFLVACLCFQMRRVEQVCETAECDDAVEFGYSITPQGRAALDADKSTRERQQQAGSVSLADLQKAADMIEDTGERKAQDARDERRRRKRAEDPDAYRPLVTNPDDPTDTVL